MSSAPGKAGSSTAAAAVRHVNKKSAWTKEEDAVLQEQVELHGAQNWCRISLGLPGRNSKSCRLRWCQHLNPEVDADGPFTREEDMAIVKYQAKYPNKWATIAGYLKGRTDNAVKNRWNSVLRKRYASWTTSYEQQQQPPPPRAAKRAAWGADVEPPRKRVCLSLFPLTPGDVRGGPGPARGFVPQVLTSAPGKDVVVGVERGAAPECLELFPLAAGDVRGNASATASKYVVVHVDCGADDPLAELRLAPPPRPCNFLSCG